MRTDPAVTAACPSGSDELSSAVYEQLKAIARARMAGERVGHTLQATALVHEAFMRMNHAGGIDPSDHSRFFRAAAVAMREILIDHARRTGRIKRGGHDARRMNVDVLDLAAENNSDDVLALDESISRLQAALPEAAEVVRLRFFAGLSIEETAEALKTSPRSVNRLWSYSRAWLWRDLGSGAADPTP